MDVGIHGVPRPREWEAVITIHAPSAKGDTAQFVVLPDGRVHVEHGEVVEDLAAAAGGALPPAFRAEAVRRDGDHWALGLRRIQVIELPDLQGHELLLTVHGGERSLVIDGEPSKAPVAPLDALASGRDVVVEAVRLRESAWEVRVSVL